MSRRIVIMGAAGSGKSTLGTELAKLLRYPYRDTDDLYWLPTEIPFERKRERTEQLHLLKEALALNEGLVLSGSFSGWGSEIVPLVDAVVWLVVPQLYAVHSWLTSVSV
jgi:adenylate kinase family enzyme